MTRAVVRRTAPAALVAAGGVAGAASRYLVEQGVADSLAATLAANVAGCFLLGLLVFDARAAARLPERLRLLLGAGFCSSFTTYSTFVVDAVTSAPALAVGYVLASYGLGLAAVLLGRATVDAVGPPRGWW